MSDRKAPQTNEIDKIAMWLFALDAPKIYALVKKMPSGDLEKSYTNMAQSAMALAKDRVGKALVAAGCDQRAIEQITRDVFA